MIDDSMYMPARGPADGSADLLNPIDMPFIAGQENQVAAETENMLDNIIKLSPEALDFSASSLPELQRVLNTTSGISSEKKFGGALYLFYTIKNEFPECKVGTAFIYDKDTGRLKNFELDITTPNGVPVLAPVGDWISRCLKNPEKSEESLSSSFQLLKTSLSSIIG